MNTIPNVINKTFTESPGKAAIQNDFDKANDSHELIRFEAKKDHYIWARPEEIIFVKSADHYVKALINYGKKLTWMSRHCTIKELLRSLPAGNFIRLNKFYLLNRQHFVRFNEPDKVLFLQNGFSLPLSHNISRYVLELFKK